MWIYLLRHGIAEEPQHGVSDEQRALTDIGKDRLQKASNTWQTLVTQPDAVFASPLVRAKETAAIFSEAVGFGGEFTETDALVPHAQPALAMAFLEGELLSKADSVAIVGHEPHLGYLLGNLLTGHPRISIPLKKGMLVGLQAESPSNLVVGLRFSLTQKFAGRLA